MTPKGSREMKHLQEESILRIGTAIKGALQCFPWCLGAAHGWMVRPHTAAPLKSHSTGPIESQRPPPKANEKKNKGDDANAVSPGCSRGRDGQLLGARNDERANVITRFLVVLHVLAVAERERFGLPAPFDKTAKQKRPNAVRGNDAIVTGKAR